MLLGCGFFPDPAPFPSLVSMATEMADQCISSAIEEAIKIQKYNSEMVSKYYYDIYYYLLRNFTLF